MDADTERAVPDPDDLFRLVGLPLLAGLDDDAETRVSAAWALCLLARGCPGIVPELAARLVAQCSSSDPGAATVRTLAQLESTHSDPVRATLGDDDEQLRAAVGRSDGWDFGHEIRADGGAAAVERAETVLREVVGEDGRRPAAATSDSTEREVEPGGATTPEPARPVKTTVDSTATIDGASPSQALISARLRDDVAAVTQASEFETISVVDSPTPGRYGTVFRARMTGSGGDQGVALRFLDPEARPAFSTAVADRLDRWARINRRGVASVHDHGTHPRPWVATDYADRTLADVGRPGVDRALELSATLAGGLVGIHEEGICHGGIDPAAVRLGDAALDDDLRPRLDDVGLFEPFREHASAGSYLDPRYAAPEHFRGGQLDQATDVYGLGGVVYRLATGRPPYEGSIEEVRKAVCRSAPIPPSDVRPELPAALDDVIAKALSTQRLTRYETARQLLGDLRRL